MATKFESMMSYDKKPQTWKSYVLPITLSSEVICQIKRVTFPFSKGLWPLNLASERVHNPKWSHDTTVNRMKKFLSLYPKDLWLLNLTGLWFIIRVTMQ